MRDSTAFAQSSAFWNRRRNTNGVDVLKRDGSPEHLRLSKGCGDQARIEARLPRVVRCRTVRRTQSATARIRSQARVSNSHHVSPVVGPPFGLAQADDMISPVENERDQRQGRERASEIDAPLQILRDAEKTVKNGDAGERVEDGRSVTWHQAGFESRDEGDGSSSLAVGASPLLRVRCVPKLFFARKSELDLEGRERGRVAEECGVWIQGSAVRRHRQGGSNARSTSTANSTCAILFADSSSIQASHRAWTSSECSVTVIVRCENRALRRPSCEGGDQLLRRRPAGPSYRDHGAPENVRHLVRHAIRAKLAEDDEKQRRFCRGGRGRQQGSNRSHGRYKRTVKPDLSSWSEVGRLQVARTLVKLKKSQQRSSRRRPCHGTRDGS